jgi:hypothetical protein
MKTNEIAAPQVNIAALSKLMMAASTDMQALIIQRGKEALVKGSEQPSNDSIRRYKELLALWTRN